jgi:hypothetical protein
MDIRLLLFDEGLLRQICKDAAAAVSRFPVQTPLHGDEPLENQVATAPVVAAMNDLADSPDTPTWELQWIALVLIYLSDPLVGAIRAGTPPPVFDAWFTGLPGTQTLAFRDRFECNVGGKYSGKQKRGSRKTVELVAKTCLELVVDEVTFIHMISGLEAVNAPDAETGPRALKSSRRV